jgi:hypothetical protein
MERDDEPTRSEEVALSNAVSGYIEQIKQQMNFLLQWVL